MMQMCSFFSSQCHVMHLCIIVVFYIKKQLYKSRLKKKQKKTTLRMFLLFFRAIIQKSHWQEMHLIAMFLGVSFLFHFKLIRFLNAFVSKDSEVKHVDCHCCFLLVYIWHHLKNNHWVFVSWWFDMIKWLRWI